MATFKICVFKKHQKRNGTYPVSIRVCWKRKYSYIKTEYYATDKQVFEKKYFNDKGKKKFLFALKDPHIINELNERIKKYENLKSQKLGYSIELYSAKELAEYFKREGSPGSDSMIDFIEFANSHNQKLISEGREATASRQRQTINAIKDFTKRPKISISEITVKFLTEFESYLRSERTMQRKNQNGKIVTIKRKGLSDVSLNGYMADIRAIFNAAIAEYNDEDRGEIRIKHHPFRKFKLKKVPAPDKRVLKVDQVKAILLSDPKGKRAILARDVFMLSFFLAGMNTVDLYDVKEEAFKNGRLSYYRQKTRDRRSDKAFISIIITPEVLPYINRYKARSGGCLFDFSNLYTSSEIFYANVNKGLKVVAKMCKIDDLTTYYARFSFASIARNNCNISKDDIDLALNHVEPEHKMADVYIEKDWSRVDNVIRKVIEAIS